MEHVTRGILDILCLQLKMGTRKEFDKIYRELVLPLLKQWNVNVLAFGPSLHEEDTYIVVRYYKDLADRQQSQIDYYGSDDWQLGPRGQVMAYFENYATIVVAANETLIDGFRLLNQNQQIAKDTGK